ncbi:MAG: hypothetical protein HY233_06025 [Acidobacteriales bacterium]|nr:hypothetical protein [Terriglobales bacterium]
MTVYTVLFTPSAGLGGVFVEAILIGGFYLFDPVAKRSIANHASYVLWSVPLIFIAGFGISLELMLESQFLRGKWK